MATESMTTATENRTRTNRVVQPSIYTAALCMKRFFIGQLCFLATAGTSAQTTLTVDSALAAALRFHPSLKESNAAATEQRQLQATAFELHNPEVAMEVPPSEYAWRVSQEFDFPTTYISRFKLSKANTNLADKQVAVTQAELKQQVRDAYLDLQLAQARLRLINQQDSLLAIVANATQRRHEAGDVGLLEKLNAENAYQSKHIELLSAQADLQNFSQQLAFLTGRSVTDAIQVDSLVPIDNNFATTTLSQSPWVNWAIQNNAVAKQGWKTERSTLFPGFVVGYLQGTSDAPSRMELGVTLPIWFWSYNARIKAARSRFQQSEYRLQQTMLQQQSAQQNLTAELLKQTATLRYYESTALPQADILQDAATRAYNAGEIGYVEFLRNIQTAFDNRLRRIETVRAYNEAVIQLQILFGL